jgi:uncharacterized protein (DUF111 family)
MKKGRPGIVLAILCDAGREEAIADLLLRETTTLGVRSLRVPRRHEARQQIRSVTTSLGDIHVKLKWIGEELIDAVPEYEDSRCIAEQQSESILSVHQLARAQCNALVGELRRQGTS